MFFTLSKWLGAFERPDDVLLMLLVLGVAMAWFARTRRAGLVLVSLVTLALVAIAELPVGYWLTAPLENKGNWVTSTATPSCMPSSLNTVTS